MCQLISKITLRGIMPDSLTGHVIQLQVSAACVLCLFPFGQGGATFTSQLLFFQGWDLCLPKKELC